MAFILDPIKHKQDPILKEEKPLITSKPEENYWSRQPIQNKNQQRGHYRKEVWYSSNFRDDWR